VSSCPRREARAARQEERARADAACSESLLLEIKERNKKKRECYKKRGKKECEENKIFTFFNKFVWMSSIYFQ
jgi:hypothetical protein